MLEHTGILRPVPRMEPVPLTEVLAKAPEAFLTAKLHTKILRFGSLSQEDLIHCAWIFGRSTRVQ